MDRRKNVLYIDLTNEEYFFKIHDDLAEYIGGTGIAHKILLDTLESEPVIFATGPLNGYFPYVSKTVMLYLSNNKVIQQIGGGTIGSKLNLVNIDALVFTGTSSDQLKINITPQEVSFSKLADTNEAKITDLSINKNGVFSQSYFSFGVDRESELLSQNLYISVDATESYDLDDFYDYEKLYQKAIEDYKKLTVEPRNNPSCFGCPIGCDKSHEGEGDLNIGILPRCLVACGYSEEIYKDIPFVYACLSSIGFDYQHDELISISEKVGDLKLKLGEKLANASNS